MNDADSPPQEIRSPILSRTSVFDLVVDRLAQILAVQPEIITGRSRLAGDLHADSLDLVEAVESIEGSLRSRGHDLRITESSLTSWNTVDDVVTGIIDAVREGPA